MSKGDIGSEDKTKRYDRQIRIWGESGQRALETADVCLVNASACGTETIKNLVLPGIRSCEILDGHVVTNDDLKNNFFVSADSVGKHRCAVAADLLGELNVNSFFFFFSLSSSSLCWR